MVLPLVKWDKGWKMTNDKVSNETHKASQNTLLAACQLAAESTISDIAVALRPGGVEGTRRSVTHYPTRQI